ncbi:MAG TPA: helix-turn-helix transcriptional regulator [Thermoanaerobaculia bacterium]|nr:helix-turn-helix transcriptional regulator [Thermoanaerobaculia bacterium]
MFAYVGETLRRLRKERGKTLEELGQEAGLGRGQLSRIENSRQEATLTTLSKILDSQGMSRREFFRRYELVEAEAEAIERSEAPPAADGGGEWPDELRDVLRKVESFVSATFQRPRPVAQGAIEVGEMVVLFRVVTKNSSPPVAEPPAEDGESGEPRAARQGAPAPAKRPARRRRKRD